MNINSDFPHPPKHFRLVANPDTVVSPDIELFFKQNRFIDILGF